MKQSKVFSFLFLLFIVQGTVLPLIPISYNWGKLQIIPEFTLVTLLMIAFFGPQGLGLKYAVLFGFLADIIYSSVLGVYAFSVTLTIYLIHGLSKWVNMNVAMTVLLVAIGLCIMQIEVYVIYVMIGVTNQEPSFFFRSRLLPTVVLNSIFTLLVYYPLRRFLENSSDEIEK